MEDRLQNPGEVPDQPSVVPDELLVNVYIVKGTEDVVSKQVTISQTSFRQSPAHAASQIFPQIDANFSPSEQRFLENITCMYSGTIRIINLNPIYVYILVNETATEVDGEERVTLCTPLFFRKNPCEGVGGQFGAFSRCFLTRIQAMGSKWRQHISMVNFVVRKYGDSLQCEEVEEDSDVGSDCSICLRDYPVGSQTIRLPCRHSFCTICTLQWLRLNGSCPLCRYRLNPESSSPKAFPEQGTT